MNPGNFKIRESSILLLSSGRRIPRLTFCTSSGEEKSGEDIGSESNKDVQQPTNRAAVSEPSTSLWASNISWNYLRNYFSTFLANYSGSSDKKVVITSKKGPAFKLTTPKEKFEEKKSIKERQTRRISRDDLRVRTIGLIKKLKVSTSSGSQFMRTRELCNHFLNFPESSCIAWKEGLVPILLALRDETHDAALAGQIAECSSLLGLIDPVPGRGVRLLSIDGGGTRGLMALEVLDALQQFCGGRKIHELFDYVVGVSTGALIAALIAGLRIDVEQCKQIYREVSVKLFDQGRFAGSLGLIRYHSYYNTEQWVNILKQTFGDLTLMETARGDDYLFGNEKHKERLKLGIVSCVAQPRFEPFLFRNYYYHPDNQSNYLGSGAYKLWEALRASAAAPGYFEECKLGTFMHQDGGVLANNPTAIGLHECRQLWPRTPIHCVVSIGTGRMAHLPQHSTPAVEPRYSSTFDKLYQAVVSATDTEKVHTILNDLLPPNAYYRTNPYMTKSYNLDDIAPEILDQMTLDAKLYVRKNEAKLKAVAQRLMQPKSYVRTLRDRIEHKLACYGY